MIRDLRRQRPRPNLRQLPTLPLRLVRNWVCRLQVLTRKILLHYEDLAGLVRQVGFQEKVLDGLLAFLLFAGALHVDAPSRRSRA